MPGDQQKRQWRSRGRWGDEAALSVVVILLTQGRVSVAVVEAWIKMTRDGVALACREFGGSGPPVMFLHGLAEHAGEWERGTDNGAVAAWPRAVP